MRDLDVLNSRDVYVIPDVALELKEVGFNDPCYAFYKKEGDDWVRVVESELKERNGKDENIIACPTQSYALWWIMKVYKFHIYSEFDGDSQTFFFSVVKLDCDPESPNFHWDSYDLDADGGFETYYDDPISAIDSALIKVLGIIQVKYMNNY